MKRRYTRTGARRAGDDYQDIVALELLVEMLEHPTRYQWVRVEADDTGYLDDIVALRSDGKLVAKQVKFSTDPESEAGAWTWRELLTEREGKTGKKLPSLLQKWAYSLEGLRGHGAIHEASLVTNCIAAEEIRVSLSADGRVDFDKISDAVVRDTILQQLGGEEAARTFFRDFQFFFDRPGIEDLEQSVRRRFYNLGLEDQGWSSLKDELRFWVRHPDQPPPDGRITLSTLRVAALWHRLQRLPEDFEIPDDYVLPSQEFHEAFVGDLRNMKKGCIVLTASPGVGKSTYLSYLFEQFPEQKMPVIRHHYFLSVSDRTIGRFDDARVAESLMSDILERYLEALGKRADRNPNPNDLGDWVSACGSHFAQQGKNLVIILDGLDHVLREEASVDNLNKLLEHLLPAPDGVVVVVGVQPLDDTHLPERLVRAAPRKTWRELPSLDGNAVKQWLQHHENELDLPEDQHGHDFVLNRLANVLHEKSQGHPLHLRYTLKALKEQELQVTQDNIRRLPGCPHEDITQYYEELWRSLSEEGREILHLLAACRFPWPLTGISGCLDSGGIRLPQINDALRNVKHLLRQDALGLRPFHSSLLVFIANQSDYTLYSQKMKRLVLEWLRTSAPAYWKWANEWLLEADLGNDKPLIEGPSREWAIQGLMNRFPQGEACEILARSAWLALHREDLARFIEVGLLRDYLADVYEYRSDVFDTLLYAQLCVEEDPSLRPRLYADIQSLTQAELVLLAEDEASRGNHHVVAKCFDELEERLKGVSVRPKGQGSDSWRSDVGPILRVAVLIPDRIPPKRILEFALRSRDHRHSCDTLDVYSEALRRARDVEVLREMLRVEMEPAERSAVCRHAVLLALGEGLDLDHEVRAEENRSDPFAAIYAAVRNVPNFSPAEILFPSARLLSLKEHEHFLYRQEVQDLFRTLFFCFCANHLWQRGEDNERWLQEIGDYDWPRAFLHRLNAIASELARLLSSKSPFSFSWFYEQVRTFEKPRWPEDREVVDYAITAQKAAIHMGLDIMVLAKAVEAAVAITENDLEVAFTSGYCNPWEWMEVYASRQQKLLTPEAAGTLLKRQSLELDSSIWMFSDRALSFGKLASLAALHGLKLEARDYVRQAATNLISHGDHKDMLLFGAFEVVEECHRAGLSEAREWLLQLAPAIARVNDFTDGDETRHLPQALAETLAEVGPDLLPPYYQWLCDEEEHYDALGVFHTFLRTASLSSPVNQALATTGLDDESLAILVDRAQQGDKGAQVCLSSLTAFLGRASVERAVAKKRQDETSYPRIAHEGPTVCPADFPPDRLVEFLEAAKTDYLYYRERCIKDWLDYWTAAARGEEAFAAIEEQERRGAWLGNYDALFDFALPFYGKQRAYPWLVKAQTDRYGWDRYFTDKKEGIRRWEMVRKHYPDQWLIFIEDTIKSRHGEPWRGLTAHARFVRLIQYCFFIGHVQIAEKASQRLIATTLELVSAVKLPAPGWAAKS